jgi:hypothetical protein
VSPLHGGLGAPLVATNDGRSIAGGERRHTGGGYGERARNSGEQGGNACARAVGAHHGLDCEAGRREEAPGRAGDGEAAAFKLGEEESGDNDGDSGRSGARAAMGLGVEADGVSTLEGAAGEANRAGMEVGRIRGAFR